VFKVVVLSMGVCCSILSACGDDSKGTGSNGGGLPSCAEVCPPVVAANCSNGPASQADCVSGCETIRGGKCRPQYEALYHCGGANPSYSCNANGGIAVAGCDSEAAALDACIPTM